jgi:hypothetical protein
MNTECLRSTRSLLISSARESVAQEICSAASILYRKDIVSMYYDAFGFAPMYRVPSHSLFLPQGHHEGTDSSGSDRRCLLIISLNEMAMMATQIHGLLVCCNATNSAMSPKLSNPLVSNQLAVPCEASSCVIVSSIVITSLCFSPFVHYSR